MRNLDRHLSDRDLVLALDGELPARHQTAADVHLAECRSCRARRDRLAGASAFVEPLREASAIASEQIAASREQLRSKLATMGSRQPGSLAGQVASAFTLTPRWTTAASVLLAVGLLIGVVLNRGESVSSRSVSFPIEDGALPVASLTPGATWSVTVDELCAPGGREQRPVADAIRYDVLRGYRMEQVPAQEYELDYLITPELGGAPAVQNLWPQRYGSRVWNAHVKDQLERLLPRLVCEGTLSLETAQREIAGDWIAAYKKYFRTDVPLKVHARRSVDSIPESQEDAVLTYPVWRSNRAPSLQLIALSAAR